MLEVCANCVDHEVDLLPTLSLYMYVYYILLVAI